MLLAAMICYKDWWLIFFKEIVNSNNFLGHIDTLALNGENGSELFYLGQFENLKECRNYLSKFNL